ncbi:hypothetical protein D1872_158040 [compost metagenome]
MGSLRKRMRRYVIWYVQEKMRKKICCVPGTASPSFCCIMGCVRRKAYGIGHGNIVDGSIAFILKIGPYSSCFKSTYITWMKMSKILNKLYALYCSCISEQANILSYTLLSETLSFCLFYSFFTAIYLQLKVDG